MHYSPLILVDIFFARDSIDFDLVLTQHNFDYIELLIAQLSLFYTCTFESTYNVNYNVHGRNIRTVFVYYSTT